MSIPAPMKVTGLTVKNSLHANDGWFDSISVRDVKTRKYTDVIKLVEHKLQNVEAMEIQLKQTVRDINEALAEIQKMKQNVSTPTQPTQPLETPKPIPGPQGPPGPPGKVGPRGLRGLKGDGVNKLADLVDVDLDDLKDGAALIWSADAKKWQAQAIFDEE